MLPFVASFRDALEENPAPRRLGDVRLRYEPGRLFGESYPPSYGQRQLPGLCLLLGAVCAAGAVTGVLLGGGGAGVPLVPTLLCVLATALLGAALHLEGKLGRRRFVLHFRTERLRLDRLRWAPGATRTWWVHFDEVSAVEVEQRPGGRYALVVRWKDGEDQDAPARSEVLVEHIGAGEQEGLLRVWRMLHNAFGLRGAGLAGE